MITTILLGMFTQLFAHAYSVQEEKIDWQSGAEAISNCRAAGHGESCEKVISPKDQVDPVALENCLTFKSEEDSGNSDDNGAQYQISRGGFARYGKCLEATKNRVFHPKAILVCEVMHDFLQHLECLQTVADAAYHAPTADSCLKLTYQSTVQGMECLKSVRGRVLSQAQRKKCEAAPFQKRAACYQSPDQRELASCQAGLEGVESKLESLSSNKSTGKDLKKSLAPILDAIREKLYDQQGAQ